MGIGIHAGRDKRQIHSAIIVAMVHCCEDGLPFTTVVDQVKCNDGNAVTFH